VKSSSCGLAFLCVQVQDERALGEVKGNDEGMRKVVEEVSRVGGEEEVSRSVLFFFAEREGKEGEEVNVRVHARLFFDGGEDPATGSANIA